MHQFGSDAERLSFHQNVLQAAKQGVAAESARAWRDLVEGSRTILDAFVTADTSYLVTTRSVSRLPVAPRAINMLERVLLGGCPKQVGSEFGLAQSTIAGSLKDTLDRLGAGCLPSRTPLALVALACSARSTKPVSVARTSTAILLGAECEIFAATLPPISHLVPPAVESVVRLHALGWTHQQIALLRGKSPNTIANQLSTAFQRTGRSGRLSLLAYLLTASNAPTYSKVG